MVNYTEILRLASEGRSQRQIAASVRSSRNTVSEVIIAAQTHGITWPFEEAVSNEQLGAILFPNRHAEASEYLEPDFPYIHAELLVDKIGKPFYFFLIHCSHLGSPLMNSGTCDFIIR